MKNSGIVEYMTLCIIQSTCDSSENAEGLAKKLLEAKLAACVQICGPIESRYWWQNKIQSDTEWEIRVKTTQKKSADVFECIKTHHPYEIPEILEIPIEKASEDYRNWVLSTI